MADLCTIIPVSAFYSTDLNHRIDSYERLATRINYSLGAPMIAIEAHAHQLFDSISIAIEMFSKYAGYTEEFLVFDSKLYNKGYGIKIDELLVSEYMSHSAPDEVFYDDILKNYRKVKNIFSWEEGSTTGVNTLFTIEQTMAQQTYFSYAMGNYGFDLVSWYVLKNWLETREKLLSTERHIHFNPRNQVLRMYPEPNDGVQFYGALGVYLEKPVGDMLKEPWVYQYALALTKIVIGQIRGKYGATNLFGGGTINYTDLLSQGLSEKDKLETDLYTSTSPGLGSVQPPMFFVG